MRFSHKIIRKDGGAEIRLSVKLSPEEVAALDRIPDDPNIDSSLKVLRSGGPELATRVDVFLSYLRIICHWMDIWDNREHLQHHIIRGISIRADRARKLSRKKRRKRVPNQG